MSLRDVFDALRGRTHPEGGDGSCRTRDGRVVDLELFEFDACPYCQRVYRVLERLGLPVRYRDVREDHDAARTLVEVGGKKQVPCLFIDGTPMYESADIVAYLERHFGPAVR